jgi:hypothetical protein
MTRIKTDYGKDDGRNEGSHGGHLKLEDGFRPGFVTYLVSAG